MNVIERHVERPAETVEPAKRTGLVRGGLGVGAATTIASAANYLSNVALGRGLGPNEFADAALVVSGLLVLSAIALGLQLTAARAIAAGAGRSELASARRRAGMAGLAVGTSLLLASPLLAGVFNMQSALPFAVLALGVPVYFVMAVARGAAQATHSFGRLSASIGIESLARLVVTIGCVVGGLGAVGAAIALSVSFAAALVPCLGVSMSSGGSALARADQPRSVIAATVLLLVGQVVISNGDLWVVAARVPEEAGVYAAVALIGRLVFIAAWSVITVVFPSLVSSSDSDAAEAATQRTSLLIRAMLITAGFGGVLTLGAAIFAEPLMSSMVGDGFTDGARLLWPYALATTLFVLANLLAVADVAAGRLVGPAVVAVGGVVQTFVLLAGGSAGAAWVVWAQVVLMAVLLVAAMLAGAPVASLLRRTGQRRALGSRMPVVSAGALGPA